MSSTVPPSVLDQWVEYAEKLMWRRFYVSRELWVICLSQQSITLFKMVAMLVVEHHWSELLQTNRCSGWAEDVKNMYVWSAHTGKTRWGCSLIIQAGMKTGCMWWTSLYVFTRCVGVGARDTNENPVAKVVQLVCRFNALSWEAPKPVAWAIRNSTLWRVSKGVGLTEYLSGWREFSTLDSNQKGLSGLGNSCNG